LWRYYKIRRGALPRERKEWTAEGADCTGSSEAAAGRKMEGDEEEQMRKKEKK